MAVRFVLGRAGVGKTHHCLEAIAAALRESGDERLVMLVPEQASLQVERALARRAPGGGFCRAEVLSFSRLAERVLGARGPSIDVLDAAGRSLALRAVCAVNPHLLRPFGNAAEGPRFFASLDRVLAELLRESIGAEELRRAADSLPEDVGAARIAAIADIQSAYAAWLGPLRIDASQRLSALRERIDDAGWLRGARIWVDGFAGFTGEEQATLISLGRRVGELCITLLIDPECASGSARDPLSLFARTAGTLDRLTRGFRDAQVDVLAPLALTTSHRFRASPTIAALERGFADRPVEEAEGAGGVRVVECATLRDEVRLAADWIRTKLGRSGGALRFRDFAVICRDLEPIAPMVAEVFDEAGIPWFLDQRRRVRSHALCRFVLALCDAARRDLPAEAMSALLATGLLIHDRALAEALDAHVMRETVRGWDAWRTPWSGGGARFERTRSMIAGALEGFVEFARRPDPPTAGQWSRALHGVLAGCGVSRTIARWIAESADAEDESAEIHRQSWELLVALLDDIDAVLGSTALSVAELESTLASTLSDATLGLAPPTLDQVLVSAIERSRHPDIRFAWVLRFNDGVFPARPAESAILGDAERGALRRAGVEGIRLREDDVVGERLLAYIALTRPSDELVVSYSRTGEDGAALAPSPLLDDVREALGGRLCVERDVSPSPSTAAEAARRAARLSREHRRHGQRIAEGLRGVLLPVLGKSDQGRLARMIAGMAYDNTVSPLAARTGSPAWEGSPTDVESYVECPFQWFARRVLKLDADRGPRPLAVRLGLGAHELVAAVVRRAMDAGVAVQSLDDSAWLRWIDDEASNQLDAIAAIEPARAMDAALTRVVIDRARSVVLVHAERWRRGVWRPLACEADFGRPDGAYPPLRIEAGSGQTAALHGRFDRVDAAVVGDERWLLVYDYKPTARPVAQRQLRGNSLQMFLYVAALRDAVPRSRVVGVLIAPIHPDAKSAERGYFRDASPTEQRMFALRPRGCFDPLAAQTLDRGLSSAPSPVVNARLTSKGEFSKDGDARPIDPYVELATRTARQAVAGIVAGDVSPAPLLVGRALACGQCPYRPVCRFEPLFNRVRVAERALPQLDECGGIGGDGEACDGA